MHFADNPSVWSRSKYHDYDQHDRTRRGEVCAVRLWTPKLDDRSMVADPSHFPDRGKFRQSPAVAPIDLQILVTGHLGSADRTARGLRWWIFSSTSYGVNNSSRKLH